MLVTVVTIVEDDEHGTGGIKAKHKIVSELEIVVFISHATLFKIFFNMGRILKYHDANVVPLLQW